MLAPMEDVTNIAFRRIVKEIANPGLMFTEFVSAMAMHHAPQRALPKMRVHPEEKPLAIQIFGADPEIMAETGRQAEAMGADLVDINMGCWVPKVVRTGSGAALLKDPETAVKVVVSLVKAVNIPVTVKVRAGYHASHFAAPELAKAFEGAGAQMLTLHARFARQGFDGQADWNLIRELRKAISIPLVGNGDVKSAADAKRMIDETGCNGVMIGRAAISNPWALRSICQELTGQDVSPAPSLAERISTAIRHAEMVVEESLLEKRGTAEEAELRGIRSLRGQLPLYIKGYPGASLVRAELSRVSSLQELRQILDRFASSCESE